MKDEWTDWDERQTRQRGAGSTERVRATDELQTAATGFDSHLPLLSLRPGIYVGICAVIGLNTLVRWLT